MLGFLIRKEILDHISGLRFLILSVLGAWIIWLSLFSGYGYYQDRLRDYRVAQTAANALHILNLALLAILGFAGAYVAILRYDVR